MPAYSVLHFMPRGILRVAWVCACCAPARIMRCGSEIYVCFLRVGSADVGIIMLFNKKKKVDGAASAALPRHVAYIMDGNGRWAKKRSMPREFGHTRGADVFKKIVRYTILKGVGHVTVYAFSTENWKRPKHEVDALMALLDKYMDQAFIEMAEDDLRIIFIGNKEPFTPELRAKMEKVERESASNSRILNVAFNYGGREELVHACNELIREGKREVSEADIAGKLYTHLSPDPDLIIRTAGEERLSNFLLWQAAYSEFYFTSKLWPDMTERDVDEALEAYAARERRFGKA